MPTTMQLKCSRSCQDTHAGNNARMTPTTRQAKQQTGDKTLHCKRNVSVLLLIRRDTHNFMSSQMSHLLPTHMSASRVHHCAL